MPAQQTQGMRVDHNSHHGDFPDDSARSLLPFQLKQLHQLAPLT